jgi:hypothetical protein
MKKENISEKDFKTAVALTFMVILCWMIAHMRTHMRRVV